MNDDLKNALVIALEKPEDIDGIRQVKLAHLTAGVSGVTFYHPACDSVT